MIDWINQNKEIFFSGLGATLVAFFLTKIFSEKKSNEAAHRNKQNITINNTNSTSGINNSQPKELEILQTTATCSTLAERKSKTKILFIDDDTKFKVVKILSNSGWINTSIIKDAKTLDEPNIVDAHILFVDVQGVGVAMGFDSEGLGLGLALKEKYPEKKIVIYSAESKGDRFHEALRKADSFLPKNADPYEFQKLVEELSIGC
jgi:hypothetical protein